MSPDSSRISGVKYSPAIHLAVLLTTRLEKVAAIVTLHLGIVNGTLVVIRVTERSRVPGWSCVSLYKNFADSKLRCRLTN